MGIFDEAHVTMFVADYVAIDASGKLTAVGMGFNISGLQPNGMIAPQHLAVLVRVPSKYVGQEFSLELSLRDEDANTAVLVPGPSGQQEPLTVAQVVPVQPPHVPGLFLPPSLDATSQHVLAFPGGLPLAAGKAYAWHAKIEGQSRQHWRARFHVPGPPPSPVFGGGTGPSDIPNITPPAPAD